MANNKHILIFDQDSSAQQNKHLESLRYLSQVEVTFVSHLDEFSLLLTHSPYKIILIFAQDRLNPELIHVIKENKNICFLRNVILLIFLKSYQAESIKQALMAGATQVYLNPIEPNTLARDVVGYLHSHLDEAQTGRLQPKPPVNLEIQCYGRIGSVKDKDLYLESDLVIPPHTEVPISLRLFSEQNLEQRHAVVLQRSQNNLFYKYHFSYQVQVDGIDLSVITDRDKTSPKLKLLWLTTRHPQEIEGLFDKTCLSIYVDRPHINKAELNRIAPQIIIVDESLMTVPAPLLEYIKQDKLHPCLYYGVENGQGFTKLNSSIRFQIAEQVMADFNRILKDGFLKGFEGRRIINRKSKFSRFYFSIPGKIIAASSQAIKVVTNREIAEDSLIKLIADATGSTKGFVAYARVLKCIPSHHGNYEWLLSFIPQTKRLNLILPNLLLVDTQDEKSNPMVDHSTSYYIQRRFNLRNALIAVLLLALFFYGLYLVLPEERIKPLQGPMPSIEDVTKSIRNAFQ